MIKKKEKKPYEKKDPVPFEELPNKIKKRIEKRKAKRESLKEIRKNGGGVTKIMSENKSAEEQLRGRYIEKYGEKEGEEKLKEYLYYQKLVETAKSGGKGLKKNHSK